MFKVQEFESGNGRNRCAGVFNGEECVASYHVRDHGAAYLRMAKAHAKSLNEDETKYGHRSASQTKEAESCEQK